MNVKCRGWPPGQRGRRTATSCAAALCLWAATGAWAASTSVDILKEEPPKGTVRRGDVIYVDDGRCPAGEVKKITGGNTQAGVARQVECVKKPATSSRP
ncbi:MAG: hypothetical protein KKC79_17410 [Gammaproteobacteria bacterium]|nr:hypothetical protein [Gammaproteobacteria bacterium]